MVKEETSHTALICEADEIRRNDPWNDRHARGRWIRREVAITVPPATEWIEVGVMLTGSGTVWLDEAVLEATPR